MAQIHHLTYGAVNPIVAYLIAFVGSLLGLVCTARARAARHRRRRTRWLVLAAITIGGAALWLMHFTAMFGFDVPDSPVRYSPWLTMASLVVAVVTAGAGLFVAGRGPASGGRVVLGGLLIGAGAVAMHYTAMAAVRVAGRIEYDGALVGVSTLVAVAGATAALWLVVAVRGWPAVIAGAFVLGLGVCGMHYAGMAAMRVRLWTPGETRVEGLSPSLLIVPITVLAAVTLIGVAFSALQAMTEEEFADDRWPTSRAAGRPAPVDPTVQLGQRPWSVRAVRAIEGQQRGTLGM
ncbi:MHYT domain-containing protein [Phytohabitans sp. ZYX-F-186]|uniref:MHYT domain-containing protein n=1 Tax=Phytohabitans maris TaxID=3071409 RepID=A0ABU0ZLF3_9ACTN|nr:MHYT domain-containing protein [Phytohabitans sp. ZYX-F-186]MDQ7907840.1 MHYT domain-containing protein [Phytohabitans sp. ZYX-F-186]